MDSHTYTERESKREKNGEACTNCCQIEVQGMGLHMALALTTGPGHRSLSLVTLLTGPREDPRASQERCSRD